MLIKEYFDDLTTVQIEQFEHYHKNLIIWNEKINLISRKDIQHLWTRHILHSALIAKVISFVPNTHILDIGTGGGLPGIPLAILFPDCHFTLIDSVTKKINAVQDMVQKIGLNNVKTQNIRAEQVQEKFDFVVSRAVTQLPEFYTWVRDKVKSHSKNPLNNGILYLKGGKIQFEIEKLGLSANIYTLAYFSKDEFFETKYIIHIPIIK